MKRPGWNPVRRSRNIGTAKQGHGQDNRLTIPNRWPDDRIFYERLINPVVINRTIGEKKLIILVERPRPPFVYPCTVDDVVQMLSFVDPRLLDLLDLFVFRHPTKRERALSPVWGRLAYFAEIGRFHGSAIYLESQEPNQVSRWSKSLGPREREDFERSKRDGHSAVVETKRYYEISQSLESQRTTMLYHTVLHECGHLLDLFADDNYFTKTTHDKEQFANRFAEDHRFLLEAEGKIPFARIVDPKSIEEDKLSLHYFIPPG